jgi:hypothetical protein
MFAPKAAAPTTGGLSLNTNSTSSLLLVLPSSFPDYTYQTYRLTLAPTRLASSPNPLLFPGRKLGSRWFQAEKKS